MDEKEPGSSGEEVKMIGENQVVERSGKIKEML